jgi:RimJ/RimL family protein N-acetyltransferase
MELLVYFLKAGEFVMFRNELIDAAAVQLSYDYACDKEDFFNYENKVTISRLKEGRRHFKEEKDFFKIATMGRGAVVSADPAITGFASDLLKSHDGICLFDGKGIFSINKELEKYNKSIGIISQFYLPVTPYKQIKNNGFRFKTYEYNEIHSELYLLKGFSNAIMYEDKGQRRDVLAVCAVNGNSIVGMAGASSDSERFWQIGIDVLPEYRGMGIAAALVSALTVEVFMRGAIPYYGTWSGNIASQNVARKCGYYPAWSEMFAVDIYAKNSSQV